MTCSSVSSVEGSKLKASISNERLIIFLCLLRLVTNSFITTLRQRMTEGIKIILAIKVVKYTVEGRSVSGKVEVVELMSKDCVRLCG